MFLLWLRQLPWCGDQIPASVPPPAKVRSHPTNTPDFPPSSLVLPRVLRGSIYSFLLARYSCLLSAGVLHALLCLKVYSWCIRGEGCTPRLPTPLPSCSPMVSVLMNSSFINLLNKTLSNTFNKTVFYQHIKQTRMKWKEEVSWGDSLVEGEDGEWNHKSLVVRNGSMPFGKWLPSASCISESWDAEALTNLPATLILICTGNSLAT